MILVTDPRTLNVAAGSFRLSTGPDDVLVTHLECGVAVCAHESELRIGAMIHFLLPGRDIAPRTTKRCDLPTLQDMIDAILRRGADKRHLSIWLFGGADAPDDVSGIGAANAEFALSFLESSGYSLRGTSTGGSERRRIRFHPHSGRVEVSCLATLGQDRLSIPPSEPE